MHSARSLAVCGLATCVAVDALALEDKAGLQLCRGQVVVDFAQPAAMLEGGPPHERVAICLNHGGLVLRAHSAAAAHLPHPRGRALRHYSIPLHPRWDPAKRLGPGNLSGRAGSTPAQTR